VTALRKPVIEYWVMRVMLHPGPPPVQLRLEHMSPGAAVATLALLHAGDLALLPDGCICEPVEIFDRMDGHDEEKAHELRARLVRDTGADYRVILNTDVTV
jgi:hypothetical protein